MIRAALHAAAGELSALDARRLDARRGRAMPVNEASRTPLQLEVRRHMRFDFAQTPAVHTRGNPYLSHFWNALSVMAPSTERILIRVGHGVRDEVRDGRLRDDLEALMAQEALHTREHRRLNARLEELGYDITGVNAAVDRVLDDYVARVGQRGAVALMAAGEHLIYELCHALLTLPGVLDGMDPEVRRLLVWHAAEEMEHQSVAHDVYVHLYGEGGREGLSRARAFADAARLLAGTGADIMGRLLAAEPVLDPRHRRELRSFLLSSPGYGRVVTTRCVRYLAPGYRPWSDPADMGVIQAALAGL